MTSFAILLIFSLYSVSALYVGEITANVGTNIEVVVGENPLVNVTDETNDNDDGGTTNPTAQTSGSSGGKGTTNNFLSSIKGLFTDDDEENKEEEKLSSKHEEDKTPEEQSSFTSLMNAAVIGVSDFVKTPVGVATFVIVGIMIVGGITFLVVKGKFKKDLPKKEENITTEQ